MAEHEASVLYKWYDAPSSPCLALRAGRKVLAEGHMSKRLQGTRRQGIVWRWKFTVHKQDASK